MARTIFTSFSLFVVKCSSTGGPQPSECLAFGGMWTLVWRILFAEELRETENVTANHHHNGMQYHYTHSTAHRRLYERFWFDFIHIHHRHLRSEKFHHSSDIRRAFVSPPFFSFKSIELKLLVLNSINRGIVSNYNVTGGDCLILYYIILSILSRLLFLSLFLGMMCSSTLVADKVKLYTLCRYANETATAATTKSEKKLREMCGRYTQTPSNIGISFRLPCARSGSRIRWHDLSIGTVMPVMRGSRCNRCAIPILHGFIAPCIAHLLIQSVSQSRRDHHLFRHRKKYDFAMRAHNDLLSVGLFASASRRTQNRHLNSNQSLYAERALLILISCHTIIRREREKGMHRLSTVTTFI